MKIKLFDKNDKTVIAEYESPVVPCKHDLITLSGNTAKVDQVEYFVRENSMAGENQIDFVGVTVKPIVFTI